MRPLGLLHGGLMTAESWDPQVPALAQQYRVYVLEQLGHGRTPDIDGPLTYEAMAQHTTAFLDALGISSAHLCGWSDGALVALLAALRGPAWSARSCTSTASSRSATRLPGAWISSAP